MSNYLLGDRSFDFTSQIPDFSQKSGILFIAHRFFVAVEANYPFFR
ncbi:hypothetical protein [Dolichospermum compactum]|nr:hypothetical protein [Dolichospermum compactum]